MRIPDRPAAVSSERLSDKSRPLVPAWIREGVGGVWSESEDLPGCIAVKSFRGLKLTARRTDGIYPPQSQIRFECVSSRRFPHSLGKDACISVSSSGVGFRVFLRSVIPSDFLKVAQAAVQGQSPLLPGNLCLHVKRICHLPGAAVSSGCGYRRPVWRHLPETAKQ